MDEGQSRRNLIGLRRATLGSGAAAPAGFAHHSALAAYETSDGPLAESVVDAVANVRGKRGVDDLDRLEAGVLHPVE